ncbi:MAG: InlB B-repeat-containing protein [Kiritimatiellae bacterium]|nr:InlB B-repeat-containing protein [Kiritimatiellia bacterium]
MFRPCLTLAYAALAAMVSLNLRAATEVATAEELAAAIAANEDITLTADVDCAGWTPADYSGVLDGNGRTVTGLTSALIGTLSGTVRNLTVRGTRAKTTVNTTPLYCGCIANVLSGATVEDCVVADCEYVTDGRNNVDQYYGGVSGSVAQDSGKSVVRRVQVLGCKLGYAHSKIRPAGIVGGVFSDLDVIGCTVGANGDVETTITGGGNGTGGILGYVWGDKNNVAWVRVLVDGCSVGGRIAAASNLGGVVGVASEPTKQTTIFIRNCKNTAAVTASNANPALAGGILGYAYRIQSVDIENCVNLGTISSSADKDGTDGGMGGILGGAKSGTSTNPIAVNIRKCVNFGDVISRCPNVGGIAGNFATLNNDAHVENSANHGKMSGPARVGGIIGQIEFGSSKETHSYRNLENTGPVTASGSVAGGIFGRLATSSNRTLTLDGLVSAGDVSADSSAGGLAGLSYYITGQSDYGPNGTAVIKKYPSVVSTIKPTFALNTVIISGAVSAKERTATIIGEVYGYAEPAFTVNGLYADPAATGYNHAQWTELDPVQVYSGKNKASPDKTVTPIEFNSSYVPGTVACTAIPEGAMADGRFRDLLNERAAELGLSKWSQKADWPYMLFETGAGVGPFFFDVRFFNGDEQIGETQSVERGAAATPPADPEREGATFLGWDREIDEVLEPMDVKARFSVNTYTVIFRDWDGTQIGDPQTVEHGSAAVAPAAPVREGYTFGGWTPDFKSVTADLTVTASYAINTFTVVFLGWEGAELSRQTVEWQHAAAAPEVPAQPGYTFTGWDKTFESVTGDMTVTAQFEQGTVSTYTVKFVDFDGSVISEQTVAEGKSAVAPADPAREGHDFTGWDKAFVNITADTTIAATYSIWRFTVRFLDWNDEVLASGTVDWHAAAVPPPNPSRTGYTFAGWAGDYSSIAADTDVKASYAINSYTVRFLDWDGTELKTESVEYRSAATAPADPVRANYVFTGWSGSFGSIEADTDVTARYVDRNYVISTPEEFIERVTSDANPAFVFVLANDIDLTGTDWTPVDFKATLDGCGHVLSGVGSKALFSYLRGGTVKNLVLSGKVMDAQTGEIVNTNISGGNLAKLAVLCVTNIAGRVSGCRIVGYTIPGWTNQRNGLFSSAALDNAVYENCETGEDCLLTSYGGCAAGLVAVVSRSDGYEGTQLASFVNCTNAASFIAERAASGQRYGVAGIVFEVGGADRTYPAVVTVRGCANRGRVRTEVPSDSGNSFTAGGIVGTRLGGYSGYSGTVLISDCVNLADLGAAVPYATVGGILGSTFRGGCVITNCVNYGAVGQVGASGNAYSGGILGLADLYSGNPVTISDCANYGPVISIHSVGGIAGGVTLAMQSGQTFEAVNCANYGALVLPEGADPETAHVGQGIGFVASELDAKFAPRFEFINCFFIGQETGDALPASEITFTGCKTPASGSAKSSAKLLSAWAEANGYSSWTQGKVGGNVYPELGIFCENPYVAGFMMFVR